MQVSNKSNQPLPDTGSRKIHRHRELLASDSENISLVLIAKAIAQDFLSLVAAYLKLARVELQEDLRMIMKCLIGVALSLPLILIGYVFGMVAMVDGLAIYWGRMGGLLFVAGINLVLGGVVLILSFSTLKRLKILARTTEVISTGVSDVVKTVTATGGGPRG
jgi:uncharacterized membrane protein YqjE